MLMILIIANGQTDIQTDGRMNGQTERRILQSALSPSLRGR